MATVAIFDLTGKIRQVTHCAEQDKHIQHLPSDDYDWVEVPDDTTPHDHRINTTTREAEKLTGQQNT